MRGGRNLKVLHDEERVGWQTFHRKKKMEQENVLALCEVPLPTSLEASITAIASGNLDPLPPLVHDLYNYLAQDDTLDGIAYRASVLLERVHAIGEKREAKVFRKEHHWAWLIAGWLMHTNFVLSACLLGYLASTSHLELRQKTILALVTLMLAALS